MSQTTSSAPTHATSTPAANGKPAPAGASPPPIENKGGAKPRSGVKAPKGSPKRPANAGAPKGAKGASTPKPTTPAKGKPAKGPAVKRERRAPSAGVLCATKGPGTRGHDIETLLIAAARKGEALRVKDIALALPQHGAHAGHVAYLYARQLVERTPDGAYRVRAEALKRLAPPKGGKAK